MKRSILLAGMLAMGFANAQTGKVGINTETPNETLEINGTLRVDNLPESGSGKIYDGADTTATDFTGTKVVVADDKGNIGTSTSVYAFPQVILESSTTDAIPSSIRASIPAVTNHSAGSRNQNVDIFEHTFTLEKKSLVVINTNTSYSIRNTDATGNKKRIGNLIFVDGVQYLNTATYLFSGDTSASNQYLEDNGLFRNKSIEIGGPYAIPANLTMVLDAGEHTLKIQGRAQVNAYDLGALEVDFGSSSNDQVNIVAYPLEF